MTAELLDTTTSVRPAVGEWRARFVVSCLVLGWLVLAGRLAQLQWIDQTHFADSAARQRQFVEAIPARPGEIVDRHGRLLATTVYTRSLFVVPNRISDRARVALVLAEALKLDPDELTAKLESSRERYFLWVKRRMSEEECDAVRNLNLPVEFWGFRDEYQRKYPQGNLAAHVLGQRNIDGVGRGGVEQSFESLIRGKDGERVLVRDARGKVIDVRTDQEVEPKHGRTVVLSLDAVIQLYAERELDRVMEEWKPTGASVIVMDPKTCDVLAMASRPTFDPNEPAEASEDAWKNMNVATIYEPGSTFKPFIVAWALQKEVIKQEESFHCGNGEYRMGRRILHDHHPYGWLSVTDILVKSSNVGMAKIGERLTNDQLYRASVNFGFGRKTGCDLPGELSGMLQPLKKWTSYSTGSIPMGQELAVTPIQIITAHAALANGGVLLNPRLMLRHYDSKRTFEETSTGTGAVVPPVVRQQVVKPEIAQWLVREPMTAVVARGTGKKAKLDEYTVFGKTGTAQKLNPETGTYDEKRHIASFLGGAPSDDPRALVLIVVDEPTQGGTNYGGLIAAPHVSRLLKKTLIHLRVPGKMLPEEKRSPARSRKK